MQNEIGIFAIDSTVDNVRPNFLPQSHFKQIHLRKHEAQQVIFFHHLFKYKTDLYNLPPNDALPCPPNPTNYYSVIQKQKYCFHFNVICDCNQSPCWYYKINTAIK